MPTNDIEGRKKYDFSCKNVEPRDASRTIDEMLAQGWMLESKEGGSTKVFLVFYKKNLNP